MPTRFLSIIRRFSLLMAIEATLAIALAYYFGTLLSTAFHIGNIYISGLWCSISSILVLQVLISETHKAAWLQLIGSFFGSLVAGIIATLFGYHVWVLWISIFLTIIVLSALHMKFSFRLACLTVLVVIIIGHRFSPLHHIISRLVSLCHPSSPITAGQPS